MMRRSGGTCVILEDASEVRVPADVFDLESFRRWALSDSFPERGRFDFLDGDVEIDMSPEDLGTHADPRQAIANALWREARDRQLGRVWDSDVLLSNTDANLSCEPDVLFVSWEALESGRARLVPKASGEEGRYVEIEGTADLVVEVLSDSSVTKDRVRLAPRYHAASVREYWLVDARGESLVLQVLFRQPEAYVPAPTDKAGFAHSAVLQRNVRLVRTPARMGLFDYTLEIVPAC